MLLLDDRVATEPSSFHLLFVSKSYRVKFLSIISQLNYVSLATHYPPTLLGRQGLSEARQHAWVLEGISAVAIRH